MRATRTLLSESAIVASDHERAWVSAVPNIEGDDSLESIFDGLDLAMDEVGVQNDERAVSLKTSIRSLDEAISRIRIGLAGRCNPMCAENTNWGNGEMTSTGHTAITRTDPHLATKDVCRRLAEQVTAGLNAVQRREFVGFLETARGNFGQKAGKGPGCTR